MGSDSHDIFSLPLAEERASWTAVGTLSLQENYSVEGLYRNSPTTLCFNHDCTKILATYREFPLTIWSLNTTKVLRKLTRVKSHKISLFSQPFVCQAQWHPSEHEILGIFTDGFIFKCSTIGTFQYELETEPGNMPSKIQCSPDGRVFATSDFGGIIRIYDYHTFSRLYQLSNEDVISELRFSHDSKRLYDIRGNYCNVWEPNVLLRLSDADGFNDVHSDSGSIAQSNTHSEAFADMSAPIVAVCTAGKGPILCTGDDDGVVVIHNYATGDRRCLGQSPSGSAVESLTWSNNCRCFAYADIGGKIALFSMEISQENGVPSLDHHKAIVGFKSPSEDGCIMNILLNADGSKLLIVFRGPTQLWSTQPCLLLASHSNENLPPC